MYLSYSGPIGLSVNGLAAFLSGAASYFIPTSPTGVIADPAFLNELDSMDRLYVFLEAYGSFSLNVKQFQLLDENVQEALKVFIDEGLVELLDLSPEGTELFEMLKSRLSDEEALSLAQALDSNADMVVVESQEAKKTAVELGIRPLTYEDFLLDAFRRGLIKAKEILKTLL